MVLLLTLRMFSFMFFTSLCFCVNIIALRISELVKMVFREERFENWWHFKTVSQKSHRHNETPHNYRLPQVVLDRAVSCRPFGTTAQISCLRLCNATASPYVLVPEWLTAGTTRLIFQRVAETYNRCDLAVKNGIIISIFLIFSTRCAKIK